MGCALVAKIPDFQFISYPQKSARLQKKTSEALEAYLIFETDQPKGAANEISLLARTLDHACDVYAERGQSLPPNLIFEAGCVEIVAASDSCVLPCFFSLAAPDGQHLQRSEKPVPDPVPLLFGGRKEVAGFHGI